MSLLSRFLAGPAPHVRQEPTVQPRNAVQSGTSMIITTSQELEEAMRNGGGETVSGQMVTPNSAMRVSAVYRCVMLLSGLPANMPRSVMRRVDDRTRETASDHPVHSVLTRRPNHWQKPAQFFRMAGAHILLRGNFYALKVRNVKGQVISLLPMHPDRVSVKQTATLEPEYTYIRPDGRSIVYKAKDILHVYLLTLNGYSGVTPLTYARETIGAAMAMEHYGATVFKNGARVSGMLTHPKKLGVDGLAFLSASMEEYRQGGGREGKDLVLEEGMTYERLGLTSEDAQWIQARSMTNSDIYRFFGVLPHMMGDTEKSTSWGSGIEEQTNGFIAFSLEDYLTMWEEACTIDLLTEPDLYVRWNRASLVRGNTKVRKEAGLKEVQMGAITPNEYRTREDMNPIEGGDERYPPPNLTADPAKEDNSNQDTGNDTQK